MNSFVDMPSKTFNDYSSYIRKVFNQRVQKISVNTGYSCPNRNGTKGSGGCTYCNISSIKPEYSKASKSITQQLEEGIAFFSQKYKTLKYFSYFQSYTNTYSDKSTLIKAYEEALGYPGIEGIIVATRPDCIDQELVEIFQKIAQKKYVSIELGLESTSDETLSKTNRCHTYRDSVEAIKMLSGKNIHIGVHLILGFPWESRDDMISHAKEISKLPVNSVKLHHLQVLRNTKLEKDFMEKKYKLLSLDEYILLVIDFLEHLSPEISIQRFIAEAPEYLLIAPKYNRIKNYQFSSIIEKEMNKRNTWQGKKFEEVKLL